MSAQSPLQRHITQNKEIPSRRIVVNDASQLPLDYSTTPGGTIFSTTPGGTRIIYDRAFLKQMRNSPLARTPPKNLPLIPGVTAPLNKKISPEKVLAPVKENVEVKKSENGDEPQFEMDI